MEGAQLSRTGKCLRQDLKSPEALFVLCSRIGAGPVRRNFVPVPTQLASDMLAVAQSWSKPSEVFWLERVRVKGREESLSVATKQNTAEFHRFVLDVKNPHGNQANMRVCALAGKRSVKRLKRRPPRFTRLTQTPSLIASIDEFWWILFSASCTSSALSRQVGLSAISSGNEGLARSVIAGRHRLARGSHRNRPDFTARRQCGEELPGQPIMSNGLPLSKIHHADLPESGGWQPTRW